MNFPAFFFSPEDFHFHRFRLPRGVVIQQYVSSLEFTSYTFIPIRNNSALSRDRVYYIVLCTTYGWSLVGAFFKSKSAVIRVYTNKFVFVNLIKKKYSCKYINRGFIRRFAESKPEITNPNISLRGYGRDQSVLCSVLQCWAKNGRKY